MITIRKAEARGGANFGWLDSKHTFSFGQYYDPNHMGVSALRVINDDKVDPGAGFATHGHQNMEIISLVTKGAMVHKDSEGNEQLLPTGEFQLMSAGSGIMHSEYNASSDEPLHFLQIWVQPNVKGGKPGYQQKRFDAGAGLTTIISPDGREGTLKIKQDAFLSELNLPIGENVELDTDKNRRYYLHVIEGELSAQSEALKSGDGATLEQLESLSFVQLGDTATKAILFDLP
jgi:redox-sensitive bicupin YhaK (pirin superfamily)